MIVKEKFPLKRMIKIESDKISYFNGIYNNKSKLSDLMEIKVLKRGFVKPIVWYIGKDKMHNSIFSYRKDWLNADEFTDFLKKKGYFL